MSKTHRAARAIHARIQGIRDDPCLRSLLPTLAPDTQGDVRRIIETMGKAITHPQREALRRIALEPATADAIGAQAQTLIALERRGLVRRRVLPNRRYVDALDLEWSLWSP